VPSSQEALAPFARLSGAPAPKPREQSRFARFFLAPFRDIDHRAARLAAARQAEREARESAMSAAVAPQR
jgi:hypothetical protein